MFLSLTPQLSFFRWCISIGFYIHEASGTQPYSADMISLLLNGFISYAGLKTYFVYKLILDLVLIIYYSIHFVYNAFFV